MRKKGDGAGGVMILYAAIFLPPSNFLVEGPTMLQRSLTRVENFLIKVPFATEWEVLPADRPKERDRPTGHVRPERGTAAAAY